MSSNKDNEVKNSTEIEKKDANQILKEVRSRIRRQRDEEIRRENAEYLRSLADICFEQAEYEKAIDLYQEAEKIARYTNPILTSFIQGSIASAYAKLHNFDLATHYYVTARYTMVRQLGKNAASPPARTNNPIMPKSILISCIILTSLISIVAIYLGYIGFIEGDASSLPRLMLDISLITMLIYSVAFTNLVVDRWKTRNRRKL